MVIRPIKKIMNYRKLTQLLITLAIALLVASCSDSQAVRLRYEAERLYYQADRQMKIAADAPETLRMSMMKSAADAYGVSLEYALASLDSISAATHSVEKREVGYLAFQAANRLSSLYFRVHNFDTCVTILSRLLDKSSYDGHEQVTTNISLGRALQASGQWDSALVVYHAALGNHFPPVDDSGNVIKVLFNIPSHIFQIAQAIGDSAAAREHYEIALEYYNSLITEDSDSSITTMSHTALAKLYYDTGQWGMVISQLRHMADSSADNFIDVQINIADIYTRLPQGRDSAIAQYGALLDNLKPSDSMYIPHLKFKIARMKIDAGEYSEARERLLEIKKNHQLYYNATPLVQFSIAQTFELLGNWNRAETEYKYLIEKFRGSQQAMGTYLHIGDHYRDQDRNNESQKWYRDAENYYDEIATRRAGTLVEARALTFKADLNRRWDNNKRAAEILVSIFENFPDSDLGRKGLLQATAIYRNQLNQPEIADSLLDNLRSMLLQPQEGWGT